MIHRYRLSEYPALAEQARRWRRSRPLAGLRLLDASPLFGNTLLKHQALLAAGAELCVAVDPRLPSDPGARDALAALGIQAVDPRAPGQRFDIVLDCAGFHADVEAALGYVELTRSGGDAYRDCAKPVFWADESRIKRVETGLGTGDGFFRALQQLGYGAFHGRSLVLFGYGKVGHGVVFRALEEGLSVTVVDAPDRLPAPRPGVAGVSRSDRAAVEAAVRCAWCVAAATGVRGAVSTVLDPSVLVGSRALLANLGVEDEFGDVVPAARVLNEKKPLNFLLAEPTRLRYIDPVFALHNAGAQALREGHALPAGLLRPSPALEKRILDAVRRHGVIAGELQRFERMEA